MKRFELIAWIGGGAVSLGLLVITAIQAVRNALL
jgi:hypothetical protein